MRPSAPYLLWLGVAFLLLLAAPGARAQLLAVVANGSAGIQVIDVADPVHPTILGSQSTGGDARDVILSGNFAFVADSSRSFTSVDISDPQHPVVRASTPSNTGGFLQDVAVAGRFAFGADVFFVNGVPIIDVSTPATPVPVAILDFRTFRDDNGTGIAADTRFVYLTAEQGSITENGTVGDARLYIGQYLVIEDTAGIPPTVSITAPTPIDTLIKGQTITLRAEATDDIAVAAVSFLVNGQVVFTDMAAPFETSFSVPMGATSLTIGAQAMDFGSNVGVARDVIVPGIPDPGTTVVGRIVDPDGQPVNGATVTCLGVTGLTQADGTFSIPGVPTIHGDIRCTATFVTPEGRILTTTGGGVTPVRGGTTDIGTVAIIVGLVYVTNGNSSSVSVIDLTTNTVVATVAVVAAPFGVAITPDGAHAYVTSTGSNIVSVIDTATNMVVTTIGVGPQPFDVAFTPDGALAYVPNEGANTVSVIDTVTNTVVAMVVVGQNPTSVAITPNGARAYVTNISSRTVSVIDTATNTVIATVLVGTSPYAAAITPDGIHVYVANIGANTVSVIDTATNTVIATVPVGTSPQGVVITPNGAHAYVTIGGADSVSVIATATNTVVDTVPVGDSPFGVAITPDGVYVYVANTGDNTVSVIDTATNTVLATVAVGINPGGVAIGGAPFHAQ